MTQMDRAKINSIGGEKRKTAIRSAAFKGTRIVARIAVIDPTTGQLIECSIDGLTHAELEALPLEDRICEEVPRELAPCLPEEFLAAYVIRVGVVRAGATILGAWMGDHARRWANSGSDASEPSPLRLVTD